MMWHSLDCHSGCTYPSVKALLLSLVLPVTASVCVLARRTIIYAFVFCPNDMFAVFVYGMKLGLHPSDQSLCIWQNSHSTVMVSEKFIKQKF